jgi:ribosomal protein S18 acetylase RimI-like enzyme
MSRGSNQRIVPLQIPEHLEQARELLREYGAEIQSSVCTGAISTEIAHLPGEYGPPDGMFFLAHMRGAPAGCVAFRRIADNLCEMKRLYVRPPWRGNGLGRQLAEVVINAARSFRYRAVRLDTLPSMTAAQALYRSLGFAVSGAPDKVCDPSLIYLELRLSRPVTAPDCPS